MLTDFSRNYYVTTFEIEEDTKPKLNTEQYYKIVSNYEVKYPMVFKVGPYHVLVRADEEVKDATLPKEILKENTPTEKEIFIPKEDAKKSIIKHYTH